MLVLIRVLLFYYLIYCLPFYCLYSQFKLPRAMPNAEPARSTTCSYESDRSCLVPITSTIQLSPTISYLRLQLLAILYGVAEQSKEGKLGLTLSPPYLRHISSFRQPARSLLLIHLEFSIITNAKCHQIRNMLTVAGPVAFAVRGAIRVVLCATIVTHSKLHAILRNRNQHGWMGLENSRR
jgi:hypothetical protein